MSDSFTNAGLWAQKAYAQAASGPAVPPPPDGPLTNEAAAGVAPLPDGVTWADPLIGSVYFAGAANPRKAFLWYGALACVQKGSLAYATIAYNCITAERTSEFGWLGNPVAKHIIPQAIDPLTGLPSWQVDPNDKTQNLPGPVWSIPSSVVSIADALAYSEVRKP